MKKQTIMTMIMLSALSPIKARAEQIFSGHFSKEELQCKCCGTLIVDPRLLDCLESLRKMAGNSKIKVLSGYRCPKHNRKCGGTLHSEHMRGRAVDIKISNKSKPETIRLAKKAGFTFVKGYPTWVHVDVR